MRIGFSPSIYNIREEVSNISVCAIMFQVTGNVQRTTNITMETRSLNCGEM
jgi:hypothetical protein